MRKHSSKLVLLFGTALAAARLTAPAFADPHFEFTSNARVCAILRDTDRGTFIAFSNFGTTPIFICNCIPVLCGEGFNLCVENKVATGAVSVADLDIGNTVDDPGGNAADLRETLFGPAHTQQVFDNSGKPTLKEGTCTGPFITVLDPSKRPPQVSSNLPQTGSFSAKDGSATQTVPVFDVADLQPGTVVNLVVTNEPTSGHCIGVRTTFQFTVGTCKLCKIRKLFNRCATPQRLTQVKEIEIPCFPGIFRNLAGPGGFTTVLASGQGTFPETPGFTFSSDVTLQALGNVGGKITVGSNNTDAEDDLLTCLPGGDFLTGTTPVGSATDLKQRTLEASINFVSVSRDANGRPIAQGGGATLKQNQETFVTFCIDIRCPGLVLPTRMPKGPIPDGILCPFDIISPVVTCQGGGVVSANSEVTAGFTVDDTSNVDVNVEVFATNNAGSTDVDLLGCDLASGEVSLLTGGRLTGKPKVIVIKITVTDAFGNQTIVCCVKTIPASSSTADIAAANAAAAAAEALCNAGKDLTKNGFLFVDACAGTDLEPPIGPP